MANEKKSLQDKFLDEMRTSKTHCTLFTVNGVQLHGVIKSYDQYAVLIESTERNQQNFIYKHAISTITPAKFVKLDAADGDRDTK